MSPPSPSSASTSRPRERLRAACTLLLLATITVAFWKLRILDAGTLGGPEPWTTDLYTEHFPMASYGFRSLRSGRLPLWNPYQLCGLPFLAVPHTGLLYVGNLPYLLLHPAVATEVVLIAHLLLAGVGMVCLARRFGFGWLGGIAGALTFAWSGWMMMYIQQAAPVSAMCWLPITAFAVDGTMRGSRKAALGLTLAVACQLLVGAHEYVVYNVYGVAGFAALHVVRLARERRHRIWARRLAVLIGCFVGGTLLALPQFLPSLELVGQSVRLGSGVPMSWDLAGAVPPASFVASLLGNSGAVRVGILPVLGLGIGLGVARLRGVWLVAASAALGAALLTFGGDLYRLYHETPLGSLFRTPMKLLHVHAFAQALLGAALVGALAAWAPMPPQRIRRQPGWYLCVLAGVVGAAWLAHDGASNLHLLGAVVLVLAFPFLPGEALRLSIVPALVLAHGVAVFENLDAESATFLRPVRQREVFDAYAPLFEPLERAAGAERIYLSPAFRFNYGLQPKQGLLRQARVSVDYEALATQRQAAFFERASGIETGDWFTFVGYYRLGPESRWSMMDLTSTRFYVVQTGEPADVVLRRGADDPASGVRRVAHWGWVSVYERMWRVPRAYFVPSAIVSRDPEGVLRALEDPSFDPRETVVLEEAPAGLAERGWGAGSARIEVDDPERVSASVVASAPGFLVLTDTFYPGWVARVDDRETPIYRANYLFRAVEVGAGRSRVVFEYRPGLFRLGVIASALTAAVLIGAALAPRLRRDHAAHRSGAASS